MSIDKAKVVESFVKCLGLIAHTTGQRIAAMTVACSFMEEDVEGATRVELHTAGLAISDDVNAVHNQNVAAALLGNRDKPEEVPS